MAIEDLTGKTFGYLKVVCRADDHISKSGQKKVCWLCECTLCGNKTAVIAQSLKRGNTKSCGCYQALARKSSRNKKICVFCGKEFESPPSAKTVTCSNECRKEYAKIRNSGRKMPEEAKRKISLAAAGRDMTDLQIIATSAAMRSPKSGRFITNINAMDWHLISPDGKHYHFHSLNLWLRENGRELFGCEPDSREFNNVRIGLEGAKRAALGKIQTTNTYKKWRVVPTGDDLKKGKKKK